MKRLHTSAAQPSCVFFFVSLLSLAPPPSLFPFHPPPLLTRFTCRMNPFFAWIHVWVADKAAGSVEQSRQICLFTPRQCGTTAMTTGAGLDIYLACWLMSLNCLKALRGNFFFPFFFLLFCHLSWSLQYSVFSLYACVRFCVNTADKVKLLREGQRAVMSSVLFYFFSLFFSQDEGGILFWCKPFRGKLVKPDSEAVLGISPWFYCRWRCSESRTCPRTVRTSKASGWKTQPCSACLGRSLSQW